MPTYARLRRLFVLQLCAAALAAGACGGGGAPANGDPGPTGGAGGGGFHPAAHPALPQVVTLGGRVLTAPKVLPIVTSGDPGLADVTAFLNELAGTATWAAVTAEYGVGPLTVLPPVTMNTPAAKTVSDSTLQSILAANTSGTNPPWGAADAQTIYLFLLPEGTIEQDSDGACCTDFDGYHLEARAGSLSVPYAVSCACPGFDGPAVTPVQERTVAISHELFESATDPLPSSDPAYVQEDDADYVWTLVTDGEVADMCEFNDDANVVPPGATYMVQRSWSNAAAARGDNPCLPSLTTAPYLNTFPALGPITASGIAAGFKTQGLAIPIGQSKTIALTLSSAAPTDNDWTVQVFDYDQAVAGASAPGLTLSLDKSSGRNGDVLHLTVAPKKADAQIGGEAFVVTSTYGKPGDPDFESQLSMGFVTN